MTAIHIPGESQGGCNRIEEITLRSVDDVVALAQKYWRDPRAIAARIRSTNLPLSSSGHIKTIGVYYWQIGCGGADEVARNQLKSLSELGYDTVLITDRSVSQNTLDELGTPPHCQLVSSEGMDPKDYESRAHAFDDCLAQNRIDALIYNQWLCGTALWELLIAKLRNVPIVVCAHGVFSFPLIELSDATAFAKRLVELPITLPLAEAIVCASTADIAFWRARNPNVFLARYKSPSMAGLFNMDSDATTQSGSTHGARPQSTSAQPPSKPRIVWVGRLAPEKRPLDAIRIFAKVKHAVPEAILDIVGPSEGGLSDAVKQEAAKLRISGSVNLHGYQNDVARFYQNASIYLHTSATESYCLSLGEAKSWGLPCVMYELPFLELAKSGEEGGIIAIAHRDIDAAAKACIRLLESPNLLHSLGQAARRDIAPILRFSETEFWKGVLDSLRHEKELPSRREDALADDAFRVAYINAIDDLREKLDSVRQEALATRNELELIRSSTTFKVGKAVLAIPTRIKDAILSRHR